MIFERVHCTLSKGKSGNTFFDAVVFLSTGGRCDRAGSLRFFFICFDLF